MWSLVVPVKRLTIAKSRLVGAVPGVRHCDLVLALAVDTVTAALRAAPVTRLVAVTDDPAVAAVLRAIGADVVPDEPAAGLNPALEHGAAYARSIAVADGVAVLSADVAALRTDDLAAALTAAAPHPRTFVRDLSGLGTTLLTAGPRSPLEAAFGSDSAQAHLRSGAVELTAGDSLRSDIDTAADLTAATALGLGPRLSALLGSTG